MSSINPKIYIYICIYIYIRLFTSYTPSHMPDTSMFVNTRQKHKGDISRTKGKDIPKDIKRNRVLYEYEVPSEIYVTARGAGNAEHAKAQDKGSYS